MRERDFSCRIVSLVPQLLKQGYGNRGLLWNLLARRATECEYKIRGLILHLFFATACLLFDLSTTAVENRNDVTILDRR